MEEALRRDGSGGAKRAEQLEGENRRLKSLIADLTLDKHMLQEMVRKILRTAALRERHLARRRLPHQQAAGLQAQPARPVYLY